MKLKVHILKGVSIAALLVMSSASFATTTCDVGCMGKNSAAGGSGVLQAVYVGLTLLGVIIVASGLFGLYQGRNSQEPNGTHWKKVGFGALLGSVFGVILAINAQVFGNTSEIEKSRTLIESSKGSS